MTFLQASKLVLAASAWLEKDSGSHLPDMSSCTFKGIGSTFAVHYLLLAGT